MIPKELKYYFNKHYVKGFSTDYLDVTKLANANINLLFSLQREIYSTALQMIPVESSKG